MAAPASTCEAALAACCPPTATRPVAISSAACSRDRARPRRTSSASSRSLLVIGAAGCLARRRAGGGPGVQLSENLRQLRVHLLEQLGMIADRQSRQPVEQPERSIHPWLASPRPAISGRRGRGDLARGHRCRDVTVLGGLGLVLHSRHHILIALPERYPP